MPQRKNLNIQLKGEPSLQTIVLLLIAVIIGLLNLFSTPTMMEDLQYRYVWQPEWNQPLERISSLGDVFKSQEIHYWSNSGRVVIHFVAQVLLNLTPDWLSKLLNTVFFLFLILLITKVVHTSKEFRAVICLLSFTILFILTQGFYMGYIWLIGANNYLWTLVVNLVFILILRDSERKNIKWYFIFLSVPISLIAGWSHEALSVPISVALLLWMICHRKGLWQHWGTYLVLTYMLGVLLLFLSPALWDRVNENGITLQQRLVNGAFNLVLNVRISWLLLLTLAIKLRKGRKAMVNCLLDNRYILTAWAAALGIVLVCGETLERVAIFCDFLALLAILNIWQGEWLIRYKRSIVFVCMLLCIIVATPAILLNHKNYDNYLYHCEQLENNDTIIKIRQLPDGNNMAERWIRKQYTYPNVEFGFPLCYMAFDSDDLNNVLVSHLFHRKNITMLPEDVLNNIENHKKAYEHWEADKNQKIYIWRLQPSQQVNHVIFELNEEIQLPFYLRLFSYQGNSYELDKLKYKVITLGDNNYLVMTIPSNKIKRRIKNIVYDE